jgi:D-xylose transport system permease protein
MVLVIVTRNIDLSVGSIAWFRRHDHGRDMQADFASVHDRASRSGDPTIWMIALAVGLIVGVAIGAFQGFLIAYLSIPAFIVTLGGLSRLARRGLVGHQRPAQLPRWMRRSGSWAVARRARLAPSASWIVGRRCLRGGGR